MTRQLSSSYIVNGFPWWGTREDNATEVASEAAANHPIVFVKLEFDSGNVNLHSGHGTISFGGDSYTGAGRLGTITGIEENSELARTPITLTLSGLPTDLLAALLSEHYQGRMATVYHGYLSMTTYQLVGEPVILYRGLMDSPTTEQGETLTISLGVESRFAQWDRAKERRYSNEDQRSRFPSDTFFQHMEQGVEKQIVWGAKAP